MSIDVLWLAYTYLLKSTEVNVKMTSFDFNNDHDPRSQSLDIQQVALHY